MEVGDYIRTKRGIAKYLGLGRDVLRHETSKSTYGHYYSQHLFDNYIFDVGHDYGDTLNDDEFNNIDKLGVVKPRLIDLIEVGDYVNGFRVVWIDTKTKKIGINAYCEDERLIKNNNQIKSILTKEQFESRKYIIDRMRN